MQDTKENGHAGPGSLVIAGVSSFAKLPRYLVAIILGLVGLAAAWLLYPVLGRTGITLFFVVVVVSAWIGGLGPALVSMAISVVAIVPLFLSPIGEPGFDTSDALTLGTFLIVSLAIAWVTASLEKSNQALAESLAEERRHEARIQAVTDSVAEALVLISPDGRIVTVNQRVEDLLGLPPDRILGRRFDEIGSISETIFADPAKVTDLVAGSIDDRDRFYKEVLAQNWPQPRELELFSAPVCVHGCDTGAHLGRLYVFRDITHEREVDRMKTEFVSLVSHELRTPLTSVKGFTDMILDGDAGEIDEEVREFLEIVKSNADRLIALINDLLDISRIESGRIQLKIKPVDLEGIVADAVAVMQPQLEAKVQSLDVSIDPAASYVLGDRDKLVQVVTNYVSNAHKYSYEGAEIHVTVSRKDDFAHVAVADNGFGIAKENHDKIFSRFYRVDSTLTSEIGGTGLGLSLVKSVIEMHGGWVGFESELRHGSTFYFTVPLVQGASGDGAEGMGSETGTAGQFVLVIEQDEDHRQHLSTALGSEGFKVSTVGDGQAGLAAARRQQLGLILMGLSLPDLDGLHVLQTLKQEPATEAIPIIVMATRKEIEAGARARALAAGAADVMAHPLDIGQLASVGHVLMG